jgi:rhodanese-related sulfurtransferase
MSNLITRATLTSVLTLYTCASFAEMKAPVQDLEKAEKYFDYILEVTTNPFLTKQVVDGEVANVTIVDLRDAEDFKKGHIPGAINITNIKDADVKEFPGLRKDGYNFVYGYSNACLLPQIAGKKFTSLGYPVKAMSGGFHTWKEYEYPVEK